MPATAKQQINDEFVTKQKSRPSNEDIMRPPNSDLSSSGEENCADIEPVVFKRSNQKSKIRQQHDERNKKSPVVGLKSSSGYSGVNSYRLRRGIGTSTKTHDTRSAVYVIDRESYGSHKKNLKDTFGKVIHRKKDKQAVYGRSSQPSSQSTVSSQAFSSPNSQAYSNRKFKRIKILSDSEKSDDEILSTFKPPSSEFLDYESPEDFEPEPSSKAYLVSAYSSRTPSPAANQKFTNDLTATTSRDDIQLPKFKQSIKFEDTPPSSFNDPSSSIEGSAQESKNILVDVRAKLILKTCKSFDFEFDDDDVPTSSNMTSLSFDTAGYNEDSVSLAPIARCPMCNEPVSPNGLRSRGNMNTRRQEQFCLAHRKKAARKQWQTNHYPNINWNNLDTRISKHHMFLKDLINGKNSFYRSILQEKVDQGRDRNLRTTTGLIPGYYGPRGLHIISENVFRKFTPLLRKRIVHDRLIAARGYTPYVQSVLVPEVAVLLIQEDMQISAVEARNIMAESATVGELLHEELRDVFKTTDHCD